MPRSGLLLLLGLLAFWAELAPGSGQRTPPAKRGTCPMYINPNNDTICGLFCSVDDNCPGEEKCCSTGCGKGCRLPSESKRGYCPKVTLPPGTATICLVRCSGDDSCQENFHTPVRKCCPYGCQWDCQNAVDENPGVCLKRPVIYTFAPCQDTCKDDRDCSLPKKCCFTGCSLECREPVRSERCQLPPVMGPCRGNIRRYHYSPDQKRCLPFIFGGCHGNSNNFKSQKECQEACGKISPEVCKLPKNSGPCLAYSVFYYYDSVSRMCKKFVYGGCKGNGNRFSTKTECMMVCGTQRAG